MCAKYKLAAIKNEIMSTMKEYICWLSSVQFNKRQTSGVRLSNVTTNRGLSYMVIVGKQARPINIVCCVVNVLCYVRKGQEWNRTLLQ